MRWHGKSFFASRLDLRGHAVVVVVAVTVVVEEAVVVVQSGSWVTRVGGDEFKWTHIRERRVSPEPLRLCSPRDAPEASAGRRLRPPRRDSGLERRGGDGAAFSPPGAQSDFLMHSI
ncbi:hypothetical protein EYF80_062706 [Liparis tanakae]|uniref:Uncharacterized protein n=1 Tax=Liparis tanakae TaxID=230148 RepID=A0A4Z2EE67_9TELE|nr:hypothetical protein EYF80_062706 [Liparis tanakae]